MQIHPRSAKITHIHNTYIRAHMHIREIDPNTCKTCPPKKYQHDLHLHTHVHVKQMYQTQQSKVVSTCVREENELSSTMPGNATQSDLHAYVLKDWLRNKKQPQEWTKRHLKIGFKATRCSCVYLKSRGGMCHNLVKLCVRNYTVQAFGNACTQLAKLLAARRDTVCYMTARHSTVCFMTARHGTICYMTARHDTVCYMTARHGTVCFMTARHGTICYMTARHGTICYMTARHDTVCYMTARHGTVCYMTARHSTVCCMTARHGTICYMTALVSWMHACPYVHACIHCCEQWRAHD